MKKPKRASDWDVQLKHDLEWAKRKLLDDGELRPMLILHSERQIKVLLLNMDASDKRRMRDVATLHAIADNAFASVMMSEAWMATARKEDEPDPMHPSVMPRDREDRQEVIILHIAYRDDAGERRNRIMAEEILRGNDGKPCGFKSMDLADIEGVQSPWFGVLPEERPDPIHREAARALLHILGQDRPVKTIHPAGRA